MCRTSPSQAIRNSKVSTSYGRRVYHSLIVEAKAHLYQLLSSTILDFTVNFEALKVRLKA